MSTAVARTLEFRTIKQRGSCSMDTALILSCMYRDSRRSWAQISFGF